MEIDPFAEVEIVSETPAVVGQKITGLDPIRERFYDMRGLAPNNPDQWHDSKLFYRQAKFMEDFTDDYEHYEPLRMYSPSYQRLGYDQLRTFFTWRTQVQQGKFLEASPSYLFMYIYELLSGVGSRGPVDGLNKVLTLWKAYPELAGIMDEYVAGWLRDYHIYYKLPHSFGEFVAKHDLRRHYKDMTMFDLSPETALADWLEVGNYDIGKSAFYKTGEENRELLRLVFFKAVEAMQKAVIADGKDLEDMFYFRSSPVKWQPFDSALFYPWYNQTDREVVLSPYRVYTVNGNRWTTRRITPYKHLNDLAGYFVKDVELQLRKTLDFKGHFPISTTKLTVAETVVEGMGFSFAELSKLFYDTVKAAYAELTRVVVTVDRQNLDRIREEAEETQDKLIVAEDGGAPLPVPLVVSLPVKEEPVGNPVEAPVAVVANDPWVAFKNMLTAVEVEALKITAENPENIKPFANENGVMLEILADGINEKAMDTIGDNILEVSDTMEIYEDYVAEVAAITL